MAVIVVHELEVVEAVADALRAEVSEQLQPHAALHHAGGVAGALALAAGLGADGDGLDAGGVLGTAVNRTSRIHKISLYRVSSKTVYTWFLPFFSSKSNPILTSRVSFEN